MMSILTTRAQQMTEKESETNHSFYIAVDAMGITILPLLAAVIDNQKNNTRLLGKIQYEHAENYSFDFAYGMDRQRSNVVRRNFANYELSTNYVQFTFNTVISKGSRTKLLIGPGISYGRIMETGIAEIDGDYFDPFQQRLTIDENFVGWLLSFKVDYQFYHRWSLEFDGRIQGISINNRGPIQVLHKVPGGGHSWLHSRKSALDVNGLVSLKWRVF